MRLWVMSLHFNLVHLIASTYVTTLVVLVCCLPCGFSSVTYPWGFFINPADIPNKLKQSSSRNASTFRTVFLSVTAAKPECLWIGEYSTMWVRKAIPWFKLGWITVQRLSFVQRVLPVRYVTHFRYYLSKRNKKQYNEIFSTPCLA